VGDDGEVADVFLVHAGRTLYYDRPAPLHGNPRAGGENGRPDVPE
jgi:hypothetical protein